MPNYVIIAAMQWYFTRKHADQVLMLYLLHTEPEKEHIFRLEESFPVHIDSVIPI